MELFKNLSPEEQNQLLKFPAYIALLASNADGKMDDQEKEAAIELTHVRSYKSDHLLSGFYKNAEKVFDSNINEISNLLPENKDERETILKQKLEELEEILQKLGYNYTKEMHNSMKSFKDHVSSAHGNILERFIFPLPIKGITE